MKTKEKTKVEKKEGQGRWGVVEQDNTERDGQTERDKGIQPMETFSQPFPNRGVRLHYFCAIPLQSFWTYILFFLFLFFFLFLSTLAMHFVSVPITAAFSSPLLFPFLILFMFSYFLTLSIYFFLFLPTLLITSLFSTFPNLLYLLHFLPPSHTLNITCLSFTLLSNPFLSSIKQQLSSHASLLPLSLYSIFLGLFISFYSYPSITVPLFLTQHLFIILPYSLLTLLTHVSNSFQPFQAPTHLQAFFLSFYFKLNYFLLLFP